MRPGGEGMDADPTPTAWSPFIGCICGCAEPLVAKGGADPDPLSGPERIGVALAPFATGCSSAAAGALGARGAGWCAGRARAPFTIQDDAESGPGRLS